MLLSPSSDVFSVECVVAYTCTLNAFFCGAPAFICSSKNSISSAFVSCFSAATCFNTTTNGLNNRGNNF
ncbi:hypothetical protein Hanom_Chr10g00905231 [Helianthus anomalus]